MDSAGGESRIRTAVGMVVASIAQCDWPDEWPELMRDLITPLEAALAPNAGGAATTSAATVGSVLRCLELCASELDEEHLTGALQTLMPLLHPIASGERVYDRRERARAVRVLHRLLERAATLCGDESSMRSFARGPLATWAATCLSVLAQSAGAATTAATPHDDADDAPVDFSLELATLRLVRLLVTMLPRALTAHAPSLLPPLGALMLRAVALAEAEVHAPLGEGLGGGAAGACDSDGGYLGTHALLTGVLDVFGALASSSRFYKALTPALPDLMHAAISLMQIPPEAQAEWDADLAVYLQDEDPDSFAVSARVAAQQFVDELLDHYGRKALPPLLQAVSARLEQSHADRARAAPHWWRLREASLVAVSLAAPLLGKAARQQEREQQQQQAAAPKGARAPLPFDPAQVLAQLLLPDAAEGQPMLLRGRALCTAARLSPHVGAASLAPLVQALTAALGVEQPAALRMCACRALADVCEAVTGGAGAGLAVLVGAVGAIMPLLAALLPFPSEDAAILTLDAIRATLRLDAATSAACEPWLTPALLQLWSARRGEHLTSSAVVDAIRALALAPAAVPGLVQRLLPALGEVLDMQLAADAQRAPSGSDGDDEGDALDPLATALELLHRIVLRRWPPSQPLPAAVPTELLPRLLRVLAAASDGEVLRAGAACLARLIRRGSVREGEPALPLWPAALARLLRPSLDESVVESTVPLLGELVLHAPAAFAAQAASLVALLAEWVLRARLFGVTQAALLVLSQAVLSPQVGAQLVLTNLHALPPTVLPDGGGGGAAGGSSTPLHAVLRLWVGAAPDVLHAYTRRAILLALLQVASPRFPELCALPVAALAAVDASAPRQTRSGARSRRAAASASATEVPLLVRVFQLAVGTLASAELTRRPAGGERAAAGGLRADVMRYGGDDDGTDDDDDDDGGGGGGGDDDDDDDDDGGDSDDYQAAAAEGAHSGAGGARDNGRSPFVSADCLATINLSDMLDGASSSDAASDDSSDGGDDGSGEHGAVDPARVAELPSLITGYVCGLREALGDGQFAQLCATLPGGAGGKELALVEQCVTVASS